MNIPVIDFYIKSPWDIIPRVKINPDEKWIKHVHCNGARFHVLSWAQMFDGTVRTICSESDCIYNKESE